MILDSMVRCSMIDFQNEVVEIARILGEEVANDVADLEAPYSQVAVVGLQRCSTVSSLPQLPFVGACEQEAGLPSIADRMSLSAVLVEVVLAILL